MTEMPPQAIRFHQPDGLSAIASRYDVYFVDSYGVLHEGIALYAWARDCLKQLRAHGKRCYILTNTPRRAAQVRAELLGVGIVPELYDDLISAGEATFWSLTGPRHTTLGRRYFYVGTARSRSLLAGSDYREVDTPEAADWMLITGVDETKPQLRDYDPLFARASAAGLPAICANPDRVAIREGLRGPAAGTIADHYAAAFGAKVLYFGKPYPDIYELAFEVAGRPDPARCVGVGDGLYTDILGAQRTGIDPLLIVGGIHAVPLGLPEQSPHSRIADLDALAAIAAAEGAAAPSEALARFSW